MKKFKPTENEKPEHYANRIKRGVTDLIIEQIDKIADHMEEREIIRILSQLDIPALEIVEEECQRLEKYEVCRIARNLIEELNAQ